MSWPFDLRPRLFIFMWLFVETLEVDAKTFVVSVIKAEEVQVKTGGVASVGVLRRRFVSKHEVD